VFLCMAAAPLGAASYDSAAPSGETPPVNSQAPWAEKPQPYFSQELADLLWEAAKKASSFSKSAGGAVRSYLEEKQKEQRERQIADYFYQQVYQAMHGLRLDYREMRELVWRVEQIYLDEARTGTSRLDFVGLRDMPHVVRKVYGDLVQARTREGEIDTYYLNGAVKTRWNFKNGKPDGRVVTFYENGEILFIDEYRDGVKWRRRKYNGEGKMEFEENYESIPQTAEPIQPEAPPAASPAV